MGVSMDRYTFGFVVFLGIIAAAIVFRQFVYAAYVYFYTLKTEGKSAAQEKALATMGESKISYVIKDQSKKNRIIEQEGLNNLQDSVGEGVGSQFGKGGLAEPIGTGVSKIF